MRTTSALLGAITLLTAACSSPTAPSGEPGGFEVLEASAGIAKSYPAQVTLEVVGRLPSMCSELLPITQRRQGNRIHVDIHTRSTSEVCILILPGPMTLTVPLRGSFAFGEYVVRINDYELRFQI